MIHGTHPKDVLHLEASLLQPFDGHQFRQWNITDWSLALRLAVTQRVSRQSEVALLEVPPSETLSVLSVLRHHPVNVKVQSTISSNQLKVRVDGKRRQQGTNLPCPYHCTTGGWRRKKKRFCSWIRV